VAVAWVLRNAAVTGAIVGARRPGQIQGVIGSADFRLSPREVAEIEAFFAKEAICLLVSVPVSSHRR
jgi:aryl-alcohol dehydrogenase-like predicted oxidoreductase